MKEMDVWNFYKGRYEVLKRCYQNKDCSQCLNRKVISAVTPHYIGDTAKVCDIYKKLCMILNYDNDCPHFKPAHPEFLNEDFTFVKYLEIVYRNMIESNQQEKYDVQITFIKKFIQEIKEKEQQE